MRRALTLTLLILVGNFLMADEGDTIVVQTIDHNTPTLPGWNSPRGGTYLFPPDSISFSKILMSYNLQCDPSQSPACGEWDYLTYTRVFENTGEWDSTLYSQPNFVVNNTTPDTFMMMVSPSYDYLPILEYINQTTPSNTASTGDMASTINIPFADNVEDGRIQFVYDASDLASGGLFTGDVTGLQLNVESGAAELKHLTIRLANYSQDTIPAYAYTEDDLETVYSRNTSLVLGMNSIPFAFPFNWDGTSNLLVDISFSGHGGEVVLTADNVISATSQYSATRDYNLEFQGWDYIDVPKEAFSSIDSAITISFWQYGNPDIQPINSSIFEGVDSLSRRVLNVHLPWSNGNVYWDAGFDGYDRIYRGASTSEFEGQWNFWTFIKDCRSGSMQILLNGNLWFIGSGRTKTMAHIDSFRIGAAFNYDGYYAGMIDDFRIWDTVLTWDDIQHWMYRDITPDHPNYNNLVAYYQFNEGEGTETADSSPNLRTGTMFGYPKWTGYEGINRFKSSEESSNRIHLVLENGNYNPNSLDSIVVVDTLEKAPINVVLYDPDNPPFPLDTLTRWPSYYNNYVFDDGGIAIDSSFVTPDETLYRDDIEYYGEPFEVLLPWEIARYITPYGNGLSLGSDGWTWTFDVTDYRHLLVDSVYLTAGNFQELLDLEFHMIEGTPPRDVLKLDEIYRGSFGLKNFETNVQPDTIALLPEAETFKVITRTSGHQFDNPTNCAEFCYKIHSLDVNGSTIAQWEIMQECADNPLHPQGGTWIYDRAGWCPGAKVKQQDIEITDYITGDTVILDYNSQYDEYGNYVLVTHLVSYGPHNFELDAAVEEVISPNNMKVYSKFNPNASFPIIVISNQGSQTLTSLNITYGPNGTEKTYSWTGSLEFGQREEIELEEFDWEEWIEGDGMFTVEVSNPNGNTDENLINNTYQTNYDLPPVYPGTIVQHFRTNKAAYQNEWEIRMNNDLVILQRDDFDNQTLYVDTITFPNGCYKYYMWDSGHNGISFWANNQGSGLLRWYDLDGNLLMNFNGDFGDRIYHSFYTDMYLGTHEENIDNSSIISPNPNNGDFEIRLKKAVINETIIKVHDATGRAILNDEIAIGNRKHYVSLPNIESGVYTCVIVSGNSTETIKFIVH